MILLYITKIRIIDIHCREIEKPLNCGERHYVWNILQIGKHIYFIENTSVYG